MTDRIETITPIAPLTPPKNRTGIYIDGLNFFYGALKGGNSKWLDLELFTHRLLPHDEIIHIRYFTALVNSRTEDARVRTRQETYLRALSTLPKLKIHRGRFTSRVRTRILADAFISETELFDPPFRPKAIFQLMWRDKVRRRSNNVTRARVIIEEEKGSDVNLGVYLVADASRGLIDKALVITNDSDLAEAINLARDFGIQVGLLNPHLGPTSRHLRNAATFELPFRRGILSDCQFPNTVRDSKSREIHKPQEWR